MCSFDSYRCNLLEGSHSLQPWEKCVWGILSQPGMHKSQWFVLFFQLLFRKSDAKCVHGIQWFHLHYSLNIMTEEFSAIHISHIKRAEFALCHYNAHLVLTQVSTILWKLTQVLLPWILVFHAYSMNKDGAISSHRDRNHCFVLIF